MGDFGLKIALPGYDIGTVTLQQIAFSSQYPIYKIAFSGNINLTFTGGDGTNPTTSIGTVAHNLNYFPAFRCYTYTDSGQTRRQVCDINANPLDVNSRMTKTALKIYGYNFGTATVTLPIFYYIYVDAGG